MSNTSERTKKELEEKFAKSKSFSIVSAIMNSSIKSVNRTSFLDQSCIPSFVHDLDPHLIENTDLSVAFVEKINKRSREAPSLLMTHYLEGACDENLRELKSLLQSLKEIDCMQSSFIEINQTQIDQFELENRPDADFIKKVSLNSAISFEDALNG